MASGRQFAVRTPSWRGSAAASNENSPLFSPSRHSDEVPENAQRLHGDPDRKDPAVESKSAWYLFMLTLSLGGLQIVWSVELSNGSPYLLSLGMSKSLLAFVWIAGPLTGVLVQPYVGLRSDACQVSWGKRKPFMVYGGLATMFSLMLMAWIREIVGGFLGLFGADGNSSGVRAAIMLFATIGMYVLDISINTVQAGIRAFIVDNAPAHQQEAANAWASIITGVGNVLGYVFGYLDLPLLFPFFGNTQFKVLCVIASLALGSTLLISCLYIKERDPRLDRPLRNADVGILAFFREVFESVRRLDPRIRKVCEVQFFSWMGWFPFLFYITTYIGQLYVDPYLVPQLTKDEVDKLWEKATRIGTLALLIYAIVSFLASIILPLIAEPTYTENHVTPLEASTISHGSYFPLQPVPDNQSPASSLFTYLRTMLSTQFLKFRVPGLTLRRIWVLSHLFYASCIFSTFFIHSPTAGTIMAAFVGISWAVTIWVPFALISAEVAGQSEARREMVALSRQKPSRSASREDWYSERRSEARRRPDLEDGPASPSPLFPAPSTANDYDHPLDGNGEESGHEASNATSQASQRLLPPGTNRSRTLSRRGSGFQSPSIRHSSPERAEGPITSSPPSPTPSPLPSKDEEERNYNDDDDDDDPDAAAAAALRKSPPPAADRAGMVLGLHNVAISAPQILATLMSSAVFASMQKARGVPGDRSVVWVLRMGGVAALVAGWWARGLAERRG